jgi:hypothetical protein
MPRIPQRSFRHGESGLGAFPPTTPCVAELKIYADSGFAHYDVASDLADHNPAGFLKRFDRVLAGNIGKPGHAFKP